MTQPKTHQSPFPHPNSELPNAAVPTPGSPAKLGRSRRRRPQTTLFATSSAGTPSTAPDARTTRLGACALSDHRMAAAAFRNRKICLRRTACVTAVPNFEEQVYPRFQSPSTHTSGEVLSTGRACLASRADCLLTRPNLSLGGTCPA